jgi:hypothetical protein
MNISTDLLNFCIEKGFVLFGVLTPAYLLTLKANPAIWSGEYGAKTENPPKIARVVTFMVMGLMLLAMLLMFDLELIALADQYPQPNIFIANLIMFTVYRSLDLMIVDFLLHVKLKPDFMEVPGAPDSKNLMTHFGIFFRNYIYAGVIAFVASLIATSI